MGNVTEETMEGKQVVRVRNSIAGGEELEVLSPNGELTTVKMPELLTTSLGRQVEFANNSQSIVLHIPLQPYAILRRVGKSE